MTFENLLNLPQLFIFYHSVARLGRLEIDFFEFLKAFYFLCLCLVLSP